MVKYRNISYQITYTTDYCGQINCRKIHQEAGYRKGKDITTPRWEILVAEEQPDDKIRHKHYHSYWHWISKNPRAPYITSETYWDIPLEKPVIAFKKKYSDGKIYCEEEKLQEDFFNDDDIEQYCQENNYDKWLLKTNAHPNIEVITKGTDGTVIRYCIKQGGECISDFEIKKRLEYWDEIVKEKTRKKVNNKGRPKKKEPDWIMMKKSGWTLNQVLDFIKEEFPGEMVNNYYKWSSGIHAVFGATKKVNFEVDYEKEYWLPNKYIEWVKNSLRPYVINRNNKEWLDKHRNERPKSVIWIGPTQIAKTTVVRSTCDNNYYQFGFDGMEDFDSDKPITIIDDFAKKVTAFLPGWKCWLGSQTDFTINPKYGRRKRVEWGHPTVFLNNNNVLDKTISEFSDEDLDYIYNNCIVIYSDKRKLWEKPKDLEELAKCTKITVKELRELAGYENEIEEPPSELDVEYIEEQKKRKLFEEPLKGRLIKKIRRTGSGFWY